MFRISKDKKRWNRSAIFNTLEIILIVFAFSWFLKTYVIHFIAVDNDSMIPALSHNDKVFVLKGYHSLERGDIILCKTADDQTVIKRIIGLPRQMVELRDGHTYINNKPIYEPYIKKRNLELRIESLEVPKDTFFMLTDDRSSADMKDFLVPLSRIKGKLVFTYWPLARINIL